MKSIAAASTTRAWVIRHGKRANVSLPVRVFRTFGEAKMGYYARG